MNEFNDLIKKICNELKIKLTLLPDGWLKILEKNNQIHYISGYRFDNNCYAIGEVMNDKGLFHEVLKIKNIPVVEQEIIFKDYDKEKIINYFKDHNQKIIVKGNTGNAGKEVFKVTDLKKLFDVIDSLFLKEYSISLSPFYNILNEYRVIVLNKEVRLIFGKIKPYVIGDGVKNIYQLAVEYNDYYKNHVDLIENGDYIPAKNVKIDLDFKFNLSSGGKIFLEIPSDLKNRIKLLALDVCRTLNIFFASIDIILTDDQKMLVLEANNGVTLNNFKKQSPNSSKIVYDIYKDAIKALFSDE